MGKIRYTILVGLSLVLAGCDLLTGSDNRPARIEISPTTLSFDAIGDEDAITVEVFNQHGDLLPEASLSWSSSFSVVAEVSPIGVVTARANGVANIYVSAGEISQSVPISVSQRPHQLELLSGGAQTGSVDQPLPVEVRVRLLDRLGTPIPNLNIQFIVSDGGGFVTPSIASADVNGTVAVNWKLGQVAGVAQTLQASVSGGANPTVSISAVALAGPPNQVLAQSGHLQSAVVGSPLPAPIVARVIDAFGNPVPGVSVTFARTLVGGSLDPTLRLTDSTGRASTTWTLGTVSGTQGATATVAGLAPASFGATALPGPPVLIRVISGDNQTGTVGAVLPSAIAMRVEDLHGNPIAGAQVAFTPGVGMGGANPGSTLTLSNGHAFTAWTLGPSTGAQTLTASLPGTGVPAVSVNATGVVGGGGAGGGGGGGGGGGTGFHIELDFLNPVSPAIGQIFEEAAERWSHIITGKLPDLVNFSIEAGTCGNTTPFSLTVDDLHVLVEIVPIDGVGQVLGSAGVCHVRSSNFLPFLSRMRLDQADVNAMLADGTLKDVIIHELGHTLGIGTLWSYKGLLANPSPNDGLGLDTHFTGAAAIAAYNAVGGTGYTGGAKVPVENALGGAGTRNSHWRTAAFGQNELMTGFISPTANPLSRVTAASLADLGYTVNLNAADPYNLPFGGATAPPAGGLLLLDDTFLGPIFMAGPNGETIELSDSRLDVPEP